MAWGCGIQQRCIQWKLVLMEEFSQSLGYFSNRHVRFNA